MNALWLMLGTLTAIRVPVPSAVNRQVAGRAMVLAPLGGVVLALAAGLPLVLADHFDVRVSALALAVLVLGGLAWLTRGMHLDGLADTADGLGSGRRGEAALAVMKQSDIGPFGVVTLLFTLLLQTACLAQAINYGAGPLLLLLALVTSRAALPLLCATWLPPARRHGLGSTVAQSVTAPLLAVATLLWAGLVVTAVVLATTYSPMLEGWTMSLEFSQAVGLLVACACGLLPGVLLALRARNRFGGVTGDVYGAAVEATFSATLVLALLPL